MSDGKIGEEVVLMLVVRNKIVEIIQGYYDGKGSVFRMTVSERFSDLGQPYNTSKL
jgi:hypothetical protein